MSERDDLDEIMEARRTARQMASEVGGDLVGRLADLELLAIPFFLGVDEDEDDSDMDVYP